MSTPKPAACLCGCGQIVRGLYKPGHRPILGYRVKGTEDRQYLHRLRAEKALGKPLPPSAQVHHADGTKGDTAPLVICQDATYHALLHRRTNVLRAGGNPNTDAICLNCGPKPVREFYQSPKVRNGKTYIYPRSFCKKCDDRRVSAYRSRKRKRAREAAA